MGQGRLNDLAMLSIEAELAKRIDFQNIINDFAVRRHAKLFAKTTLTFQDHSIVQTCNLFLFNI